MVWIPQKCIYITYLNNKGRENFSFELFLFDGPIGSYIYTYTEKIRVGFINKVFVHLKLTFILKIHHFIFVLYSKIHSSLVRDLPIINFYKVLHQDFSTKNKHISQQIHDYIKIFNKTHINIKYTNRQLWIYRNQLIKSILRIPRIVFGRIISRNTSTTRTSRIDFIRVQYFSVM